MVLFSPGTDEGAVGGGELAESAPWGDAWATEADAALCSTAPLDRDTWAQAAIVGRKASASMESRTNAMSFTGPDLSGRFASGSYDAHGITVSAGSR
jgi:hypothetical protein